MEEERFEQFSSLISGIYRDIQKLKNKWTEALGMKSVHIFWVYLLKNHPEGLTASELSRHSQSNRSLVSREIQELVDLGYIQVQKCSGTRRYGQKFYLTDSGMATAKQISTASLEIQNKVNSGIPEQDLVVLYRTLHTLLNNFHHLTTQAPEEK
jgi:DNA-binding MarR family transcriptional regulator